MGTLFETNHSTPYAIPVYKNGSYTITETTDISWPALDTIFSTHNPEAAVYFLPPEMYLELPFVYTCDQHHTAAIMGSAYNLPWTVAAMTQTNTDLIITAEKIAPFLFTKIANTPLMQNLSTVVFVSDEMNVASAESLTHCTVHTIPHLFSS